MQEASIFLIYHYLLRTYRPVYDTYHISIGSYTISHEILKINIIYAIFCYYFIDTSPHDILGLGFFGLHIIHHNGHHFAIARVIDITIYGSPILHLFDVFKYDPRILEVFA